MYLSFCFLGDDSIEKLQGKKFLFSVILNEFELWFRARGIFF